MYAIYGITCGSHDLKKIYAIKLTNDDIIINDDGEEVYPNMPARHCDIMKQKASDYMGAWADWQPLCWCNKPMFINEEIPAKYIINK